MSHVDIAIENKEANKFSEKDLVSFGEYLLSQKREDSLKSSELSNQPSLEERKRFVFDSDLANWKDLNDK